MNTANIPATAKTTKRLKDLAHPKSEGIRQAALKKLKAMGLDKKPRFGDARDLFIQKKIENNPCTSKGLSTMPRRV